MSRLIPTYIEQALRIEVLERAVIASESDVERYRKVYEHGFCKSHSRKALSNRLCAVCGFAKNDRIHINMDAAMKECGK